MKAVLNENGRITLIAETVAEKVVLVDVVDVYGDEWWIQEKFDLQDEIEYQVEVVDGAIAGDLLDVH